jgi:hypothetical protein
MTQSALAVLLLASLLSSAVAAAQDGALPTPNWLIPSADLWQRQIIDPYGASPYTSLALDAAGRPHVVYHGHDGAYRYSLKYAAFDGAAWQITSVDDEMATGWFPSLALDSRGEPHVAYHHAHDKLVYAHFYGGSWHVQTVDSGGDVGEHAALAVDPANRPHIAYADETANSVKYARRAGANWQIMTVVSLAGSTQSISLDMALDSADHPHICYYDELADALKHATYDGSVWRIDTVASGLTSYNGQHCSIAIDGDNRPHISFRNLGLFYARHDGTQWYLTEVDNGFFAADESSLALDAHGRPRIAYDEWDHPNNDLRYAAFDGIDWQIEIAHSTTQSGARVQGVSLALDAVGSPHISYFMDVNGPPLRTWKTLPLERWTFLPTVQRH